jgi:flotillin
MESAAQRLIGLTQVQITKQSEEVIFGQLRAAIATMTIEQINSDREAFMEAVEKNVNTELNKFGLQIVNVNITDINDESGYIDAIGRKAAAEAVNKANVDVSQQERDGQIGVATANQEQRVAVSTQQSLTEQGTMKAQKEQRVRVALLEAEAVEGENSSAAKKAEYNATLAEKQAEAKQRSQVANANAEKAILIAEKEKETAKLEKETIVFQEIAKREKIIQAQAEAEQIMIRAKANADAILMEKEAEAKGIEAVLRAKAKGFKELFDTVGEDQKHLIPTMDIVKSLPEIVASQAKAISNIKFDKITVVDSGNGNGAGVSNFLQSLSKALPAFHEILQTAGVDGPEFLGNLSAIKKKLPVDTEGKVQ